MSSSLQDSSTAVCKWTVPSKDGKRTYDVLCSSNLTYQCSCQRGTQLQHCRHSREVEDGQWLPATIASFRREALYIEYADVSSARLSGIPNQVLIPRCLHHDALQLTVIYDLDRMGFSWRKLCSLFPLAEKMQWRSEMLAEFARVGRKLA